MKRASVPFFLVLTISCAPEGVLRGGPELESGLAFLAEAAERMSLEEACTALEEHCSNTGELCQPYDLFCTNTDEEAICLSLLLECQDRLSDEACRSLDAQCTGQDGTPPPPAAQPAALVTLDSAQALIEAPFELVDGVISQPSGVGSPELGGRALFSFSLPAAGSYVLRAEVNAPDEGSNSFFVNVDAEPVSPQMIWDIELTQAFESRAASWRGSGDWAESEFVPVVFELQAGEHQLVLRGREGQTAIRDLTLVLLDDDQLPAGSGDEPVDDPGDDPVDDPTPGISGSTFYVDKAASGAKDGTSWANAWTSFSQIDWSQLQPGDGLLISGGSSSKTYYETLTVQASGSAQAPIVIMAAKSAGHDGEVIIDGQQARASGIYIRPQRHLILSGFTLRDHTQFDIYISGASGTSYSESGASSQIRVEKMTIHTRARGVFSQTSDNITVTQCTIDTPSWVNAQTDGIYSQRNHDNVYDNNHIVVYNAEPTGHDDCIQLFQDTSTIVSNNYIGQVNDKRGNAQGIYATTMHGTTVYYNNVVNLGNAQSNALTFRRLDGTGTVQMIGNTVFSLRAWHNGQVTETADPVIKNNIFFTEQGYEALTLTGWSGNPANIDNNLLWTNGKSQVASVNGSGKTWSAYQSMGFDAHGLSADPQVVSVAQNDFRLQNSSPAVNAGVSLGAPYDVAKDGVARPQGGAWDMGAYER